MSTVTRHAPKAFKRLLHKAGMKTSAELKRAKMDRANARKREARRVERHAKMDRARALADTEKCIAFFAPGVTAGALPIPGPTLADVVVRADARDHSDGVHDYVGTESGEIRPVAPTQAQDLSKAFSGPTPPSRFALVRLADRVSILVQRLQANIDTMEAIADRQLGQAEEPLIGVATPTAAGHVGIIAAQLDRFEATLERLEGTIGRMGTV